MRKSPQSDGRSHRRRRFAAGTFVVLVIFSVATARLFIWPELEPIPRHVDAIIELGGSANDRRDRLAIELAREYRPDYLVQSTTAKEAGTQTCLPAVPGVTILCFHADPNTTRGEAQYIAAEGARLGWRSVILVTTPDQALRAQLRTTRCFSGRVYVATTPLPPGSWIRQIPYQWAATVKALAIERAC